MACHAVSELQGVNKYQRRRGQEFQRAQEVARVVGSWRGADRLPRCLRERLRLAARMLLGHCCAAATAAGGAGCGGWLLAVLQATTG